MAPNRSRSNSNAHRQQNRSVSPLVHRQPSRHTHRNQATQSTVGIRTPKQNQGSSTPTNPPVSSTSQGMSPMSRYNHNLKVIRRRVPSIVSIFDQFPYVCLYHSNGESWEKRGYEGCMFLFEREEEPKYGFFILNRMGTEDFIQYIRPNDAMLEQNNFLVYYDHSAMASTRTRKGDHEAIGLWTQATDEREPLALVMMRLLEYIKKGQQYPDEYRYLPGRKPPPNPNAINHPNGTENGSDEENSEESMDISPDDYEEQGPRSQGPTFIAGGTMSELDMLFAKLSSSTPAHTPAAAQDASSSRNIMEMLGGVATSQSYLINSPVQDPPTSCDFMEMLGGLANSESVPQIGQSVVTPSSFDVMDMLNGTTRSGPSPMRDAPTGRLSLLNSIFASATPEPSNQDAGSIGSLFSSPPSSHPSHNSAHSNTQLFPMAFAPTAQDREPPNRNMDIHSPKPTTAALPQILTTDVIQQLMGLPSRSASSASSVHPDDRVAIPAEGVGEFKPLSTAMPNERGADGLIRHASSLLNISQLMQPNHIIGDATPRAYSRPVLQAENVHAYSDLALGSQKGPPRPSSGLKHSDTTLPSSRTDLSISADTTTHFPSSSELWPHDRSPAKTNRLAPDPLDRPADPNELDLDVQGDVIELNFADVAVLGDMRAFEARIKSDAKRMEYSRSATADNASKKGKQKENREEVTLIGDNSSIFPPLILTDAVAKGNVRNGKQKVATNGHTTRSNGTSTAGTTSRPDLSPELARDIILGELNRVEFTSVKPQMEKKEFIREVLMLIHTDKLFVDRLYESYVAST